VPTRDPTTRDRPARRARPALADPRPPSPPQRPHHQPPPWL